MDVFTRQKGAAVGASLSLEGGVPGACSEAGCPEGTTMVGAGSVLQHPARLKFMKKDAAEASSVAAVVQHLSSQPPYLLSVYQGRHRGPPHPGDNQLSSAIYSALGRDFALELVPIDGTGDGIRVHGYVTKPIASRGTRGMQTFFVNGGTSSPSC